MHSEPARLQIRMFWNWAHGSWGLPLLDSPVWTSKTIIVIISILIYYLIGLLNRARHVLWGSKVAKVAAKTLEALRLAEAKQYPPRRHKWGTASRQNSTKVPVLCVECTDNIKPYINASIVRRCTRCGVAAHDGCLKHVKDTCKPIATNVVPQPHFWIVCGTTYNANEEIRTLEGESRHSKSCIYCRSVISGEVLPVEPSWFCIHCKAYAHVSCFVHHHEDESHLKSVSKAYRRAISNQEDSHFLTNLLNRFHNRPTLTIPEHKMLLSAIGSGSQPDECRLGSCFNLPTSCVRQLSDTRKTNPQSKKSKGSRKKRAWWKRVFSSQTLDWGRWEILPASLPGNFYPILVFINTKSGPQVGTILRDQFSHLMNPLQVVSLPRHDPMPPLRTFANLPNLRLAIVGGDGTIGWIISCVETLKEEFRCNGKDWKPPPIAVMPVGTGNDLARCLGWGSGYSAWKSKGISNALNEIVYAKVCRLDRWELQFAQQIRRNDSLVDKALHMISPRRHSNNEVSSFETKFMNNYLGVGVDAKVALEFHGIRESHPHWFQSQIGNKLVYTGMGALDVVGVIGDQLDLSSKVVMFCDDQEVVLPKGSQGVLIVNISSYMGGINIWEQSDGQIEKKIQSMDDGKLEVLAVYGSFHLGKLTVGLSRATRLAQASRIAIITKEKLPMQIDGEPFRQEACKIDITWSSRTAMLSPK